MTSDTFFDEQRYQSSVKSLIVFKYFCAWFNILKSTVKNRGEKLAYVDLYAGRGYYGDECGHGKALQKSTPLLILEKAIQSPDMQNMLVTIFNDADQQNAATLRSTIDSLPGIEKLKFKPHVSNKEVGSYFTDWFGETPNIPILLFADPWGYKGLSLELIRSILKDWGSDCIFFFNFNRINMAINNNVVNNHMNELFGEQNADELRQRVTGLGPSDREKHIIGAIEEALKKIGGKYTLPFAFNSGDANRTSHHLIFVSKSIKGYDVMKDIMANASTQIDQGVPLYRCDAIKPRSTAEKQGLLFKIPGPFDELKEDLLRHFAGSRIAFDTLYRSNCTKGHFTKKTYRQALSELEDSHLIRISPAPGKTRRHNTFPPDLIIDFPSDPPNPIQS